MIDIKRNITTIVASSRKYVYSGIHMGEKTVTVTVQSPTPITFLKEMLLFTIITPLDLE